MTDREGDETDDYHPLHLFVFHGGSCSQSESGLCAFVFRERKYSHSDDQALSKKRVEVKGSATKTGEPPEKEAREKIKENKNSKVTSLCGHSSASNTKIQRIDIKAQKQKHLLTGRCLSHELLC